MIASSWMILATSKVVAHLLANNIPARPSFIPPYILHRRYRMLVTWCKRVLFKINFSDLSSCQERIFAHHAEFLFLLLLKVKLAKDSLRGIPTYEARHGIVYWLLGTSLASTVDSNGTRTILPRKRKFGSRFITFDWQNFRPLWKELLFKAQVPQSYHCDLWPAQVTTQDWVWSWWSRERERESTLYSSLQPMNLNLWMLIRPYSIRSWVCITINKTEKKMVQVMQWLLGSNNRVSAEINSTFEWKYLPTVY